MLKPAQAGLTSFGVYPLAAEVVGQDGAALIAERTFLPYWPGKARQNPKRQDIAWIWPLIDRPDRSACGGLLSNRLAASLTPHGRLGGLLAAGRDYAARTHLTWAVDPALLSSVALMTKPYQVGGTPSCGGRSSRPASQAAAAWLAAAPVGAGQRAGPADAVRRRGRRRADPPRPERRPGHGDQPRPGLGRAGAGPRPGVRLRLRGHQQHGGQPAERPGHPGGGRLNGSLAWPAGGIASFA